MMPTNAAKLARIGESVVDRRRLLQGGAGLAAGLSGIAKLGSGGSRLASAQGIRSEIIGGKVGDYSSFDPWFILASNRSMHRQVFNGLVVLQRDGTFEPSLAESWEFSDDFRVLTMHLRPNVQFHSGRPLVAADIVANIERAKDENIGHALSGAAAVISDASAVDDATVQISYEAAQPAEVALELYDSMFIIDPEAMADVASNPVGTGPYQFEEWVTGEQATFVRFQGFWKEGLPRTERQTVRIFSDAPTMILSYQGGDLDWISDPPYSDRQLLSEGESRIEMFESLGAFWTLVLNVTHPPFDQKEVRQAIAHAINRDVIAQNIFFNGNRPISTPFFREEDAIFDAEQATRYTYDLERARELLQGAGIDSLQVTGLSSAALPETGRCLQIIQGDLDELGISLEINTVEAAVFSEEWLGGDFELASSATAVPQRDLSAVFDTVAPFRADERNNAHWLDEEYQALAGEAKSTLDPDQRLQLYAQLRDIIVEESWVIPICTRPIAYAVRSTMEGFDSSVSDFLMLEETAIPE